MRTTRWLFAGLCSFLLAGASALAADQPNPNQTSPQGQRDVTIEAERVDVDVTRQQDQQRSQQQQTERQRTQQQTEQQQQTDRQRTEQQQTGQQQHRQQAEQLKQRAEQRAQEAKRLAEQAKQAAEEARQLNEQAEQMQRSQTVQTQQETQRQEEMRTRTQQQQATDTTTVERRQQRAYRAGTQPVKSSELKDLEIRNRQGDDLGSVDDLVIDPQNGQIRYAIVAFGGWFGIGDDKVAIPWDAMELQASADDEGEHQLLLDRTKEQLENAPKVEDDNWFNNDDERQRIDTFYGARRTRTTTDSPGTTVSPRTDDTDRPRTGDTTGATRSTNP